MSGTAVKPARQDVVRNRKLILVAARSVFADDGLNSCVETVAQRAGLGTGTLYRHFPSKDELIVALIDDLADEVQASADAALEKRDGSGLWDFLRAAGEIQARNKGLLSRLWVGETRADRVATLRSTIRKLVRDAHTHGTLPTEITHADVLIVLHGLRGVIEANYATRPNAWKRYLHLASTALELGAVSN
jgi:AcrR family transcriptional regulator